MLCKNETKIENLICKRNILEDLKPILISLYNKIKIKIEEYNSTSFLNDEIKIYVSHVIVDGKYFYSIRLFNRSEIPIKIITFDYTSKSFFEMNEVIAWRNTSLCRDFTYFKGLEYFLSIKTKIQTSDTSFFDLIADISNLFESLKKKMNPSFSDIIFPILNNLKGIYFLNNVIIPCCILLYFVFNGIIFIYLFILYCRRGSDGV
jgi:hypothetical protein